MMPQRPILRYHGGKWRLAPWIINHFPPHRVYVEPYGGAASVLLRKPRSYAEVYNDLDDEVVNVFRVLRDPDLARELKQVLYLTPFARREFEASYERSDDPVERARRTIVRSLMGFGSAAVTTAHRTGFRASSSRSGTSPAYDWAHYPDYVSAFCERLRGVTIEHRDALDVIRHHDSPTTLHYVDPPYVLSTRYEGATRNNCYRHEMADEDHRRLAEVLRGVQGMVVLSGYRCTLYDKLFGDWHRMDRETLTDGARRRVESLWLNPAAQQNRPGNQWLPGIKWEGGEVQRTEIAPSGQHEIGRL